MNLFVIITVYFVLINLLSGYLMFIDKQKAVQKAWRVPESNLLMPCLFGGFIGTFLVMKYARHKTKHWQFHATVIVSAMIWLFILPLSYLYFVKN